MTRQIHCFVEDDRENFAESKESYLQAEKNFALTLYRIIMTAEENCIYALGTYPPMTHEDFNRLVYCFEFKPFHEHLTKRQQKEMSASMDNMAEFFALSVHFNDEMIRQENLLDQQLKVQAKLKV